MLLHDTDPETGADLMYDAHSFVQKSAQDSSPGVSLFVRSAITKW